MSEVIPWPSGRIAILYSDLEGSTAIAGRLRDAAYDEKVKKPFYELLLAKITEHRGRLFQDKGDGVIAVFADTRDAVAMAADFQQVWGAQDSLRVRIGIHAAENYLNGPDAGPHLVHSTLPNYGTNDLSFASRIEYSAEGGQVLLSETAKIAYIGTGDTPLPLHPWPNRRLNKVDHPETVYELLYPGRTPKEPGARFLPSFYTGERNRYVPRLSKESEVLEAFHQNNFPWRIVAIRGAGGMGKTRLAITCALLLNDQLQKPLHFIALADPTLTPQTATVQDFVNKLGEGLDWDEALRNPKTVLEWAAKTEAILILDNCESVASESVRAFIGDLVKPGKVRLLLTSRMIASPQGMTKDVSVNDGMEASEAEQLFVETVQRQVNGWQVPDGEPRKAFERIVELTDAIPLAIELTAAHAATQKFEDIARELAKLPLPTLPPDYTYGNETETHGRHRSLHRCLNWSWRLLSETEQHTLCLCGLFVAPFTLPFLVNVAQKENQSVLNSLTRLINASLVRSDTNTGRYRLHHSTAEYARIRLKERTDYAVLIARFTQVYQDILPDDGNYLQPNQILALRDEWENLVEAHRYTVAVEDFEAAMHFQQLYNVATTQNKVAEYIALVEATNTLTQTPVFSQRDDAAWWQANILNTLGTAYRNLPSGDRAANLRQAISCYEAALRVRTESQFPMDWAMTQNNLGNAYSDLPSGDRAANLRQAISCYEAALKVYTESQFPMDWAMTQNNLGIAYRHFPSGDRAANLRQAIVCYEAALRVYTESQFPMDWAMTQFNIALLENERGENKQAVSRMKQAHNMFMQQGIQMYAEQAAQTLRIWSDEA
jgi:predicted ATPase/class 3 adenylate cyclase